MSEIYQWALGGMGGVGIFLLGLIWGEMRKTSDRLQEICIKFAAVDNRVETHQRILDRLPCVANLSCPGSE